MAIHWMPEGCDRYTDPLSGARVVSMSTGSLVANNIYCEQPYCSPDGDRFVLTKKLDFSFDPTSTLFVADLKRLKIGLVDRGVTSVCNAAWSGLIHYGTDRGELIRFDLTTFEKKVYNFSNDPGLTRGGSSVSPDQRYILYAEPRPGPAIGIVVLDLVEQKRSVVFEHPEIINPHLQFNPVTGKQILVQHNRGSKMAPDGTVTQFVGPLGTTLFVIDRDGQNMRPLPVGEPHTLGATGHECFIADTGRIVFTVSWDWNTWKHDPRWPQGNLFTARPGDEKPTVFVAPEHRFNHVCASRCGKYFVADSWPNSLFDAQGKLTSVCLVIGNFATGKYRTLVQNSMASGGGSQCTHAHPYLTADNRWVIFNADPNFSIPQVWAAEIPKGFLASLD